MDLVQGRVKGDYGARKTLGLSAGPCESVIKEQGRLWDWVQGPVNGHYGARKTIGLGTRLCKR